MINYRTINTPIGTLTMAGNEDGIIYIALPGLEKTMFRFIERHFPGKDPDDSSTALEPAVTQLKEYFSGERNTFDLPMNLIATPFNRRVLEQVARIPFGSTATYGEIARRAGNPKAVRAVGRANATNPLPIIIPCHRVIARNGKLQGYAGGLNMKKWLLNHEGIRTD